MTHANPRFLYFLAVGISGILVNNGVLALFTEVFHLHYLMSAIVATQISTLWNFLLTEYWVFGDRRATGSLWKRIAGFAAINNALLLVRGPMISGLVEGAHLHYLLANLLSIGAATFLRYFLADKLLWPSNRKPAVTTKIDATRAQQPLQQS
jgi:dolichol-phosphate mannosyltransferase